MSSFDFEDDLLDDELGALEDDDDELETFGAETGADEENDIGAFSESEDSEDEMIAASPAIDSAFSEESGSSPSEEAPSSGKKPMMIALAVGAVALLIVGGIFYSKSTESPELPEDLTVEETIAPESLSAENEDSQADFASEPELLNDPAEDAALSDSPVSNTRFFVQVANCVEQECVRESRALLKKLGYTSWVQHQQEPIQMTEIVSQELFADESSYNLVKEINQENYLLGEVYRKPVSGKYQLSAGWFPDPRKATEMLNFLNTQYAPQISFSLQKAQMNILHKTVRLGGYTNQRRAETLQTILARKDQRFKESLVVVTNP